MARLVLNPYGPPADPTQGAQLAELIVRCGGDIQRVIDSPTHSLEAFVRHVRRSRVLDRPERALVLLTETNPLGLKVVHARRVLERSIPPLAKAAYVVFVDPRSDPFFFESATKLGRFDDADAEVPIWTAAEDKRFLVVHPGVDDAVLVASRMADMEYGVEDFSSGVVSRNDQDAPDRVQADIETIKPPKLG